jgi:hypothetical protein
MTEPTDADRAKALLSARAAKVARSLTHPALFPFEGRVDRIAAALAAERVAAVADLRARVEAVAEADPAGPPDCDEHCTHTRLDRSKYPALAIADALRAAVTDTTGDPA